MTQEIFIALIIICSMILGSLVTDLAQQRYKKDQPEIKITSPTWLPDSYSLNGETVEAETLANFLNSNKLTVTYMGAKLIVDQQKNEQYYELMFETNKPIKQVSVVKP